MTTTTIAVPRDVPDGYMPIPTAEQLADALESVRCFHDMSAELIAPELLANLLAATTVKAEQVQCEVCHGQGEVYSGHDQHFHYFDFQPPEPIMEVCPECGEEAPSLPAAGSVVEDGPDITTKHGYPAYSVAQHERIVASLQAEIAKRDAAIEEWSGTAVQNGMEVDRLTAALSAQKSAPERVDGWIPVNERLPSMVQEVIVNSEFDGVTAGILDSYGEWYSPNSDYKLTRVVAWQPLPAAPSLLATHRGQASGCHSEGDQNE